MGDEQQYPVEITLLIVTPSRGPARLDPGRALDTIIRLLENHELGFERAGFNPSATVTRTGFVGRNYIVTLRQRMAPNDTCVELVDSYQGFIQALKRAFAMDAVTMSDLRIATGKQPVILSRHAT